MHILLVEKNVFLCEAPPWYSFWTDAIGLKIGARRQ